MTLGDKPLYMPWNEDDFSGDLLVSAMTPVQRWMYRTLLQRAFFHSTRPDLPSDPEMLWRLAGCESRKQWDDNSEPVLSMFKVEQLGLPGEALLYQNRLRKDWDRLMDSREAYSDRGKKGAHTRWGTEVKEEASVDTSNLPQRHLNPLKLLPALCRTLIGVRAEREDYYKKDLKELTAAYGGNPVIQSFERWAKTYNGDSRYPIKEFIRVADQYLNNRIREDNPELENLCLALYQIGNQVFAGKHRAALSILIDEFGSSELIRAYKEFISGKDDFDMKHSAKNFCEGGARTIVLATRQRLDSIAKQTQYIDKRAAEMEQEVEEPEEEIVEEKL